MLANGSTRFKVGLQSLTAQSIMEAELVAAALTMKEAVFCSKIQHSTAPAIVHTVKTGVNAPRGGL